MPLPTRPVLISPAFRKLPPPVVIVGMHRSGTSMVTGMLAALGLYIDPLLNAATPASGPATPQATVRRDGYGEAVAFRLLNEAVMRRAGATWKQVTPFLERRDNPRFAAISLLQMQIATFTRLRQGYLQAAPPDLNLWGWKDPRNSLLLPYWLRLFPEARILHVRRSAEGVVNSLLRREEALETSPVAPPSLAVRLGNAISHPGVVVRKLGRMFGAPAPPAEPQGQADWQHLYEQYVGECVRYQQHPGGYLEVQYEEIRADPLCYANRIADYVHAEADASRIQQAAAFVLH